MNMNKRDLEKFFDRMSEAVLEAGKLTKSMQWKVENIGKIPEAMPGDSEKQSRDRATKTIVDEWVQELLLKAAADGLNPKSILLDAEEDTSSVKLFSKKPYLTSLILDPIDATVEYLAGKDSYSVCVGLVENGRVNIAIVYFPARDNFYYLSPNGKSYLAKNASTKGIKGAKFLKVKQAKNKIIYKNNRTPESVTQKLEEKGYKVFDDTHKAIGVADILIRIMNGEVLAYLAHTRQMRDMLLGPIIQSAGGYTVDWNGKPLIWPFGGRLPRVMFGFGKIPKEILRCLKE